MPVKVFLAITVVKGHASEIHKKLTKFHEVSLVCTVKNGVFDVVAIVDVESLDEYRSFSIDKIGTMTFVDDYTSFITLAQ